MLVEKRKCRMNLVKILHERIAYFLIKNKKATCLGGFFDITN